MAPWNLGNTCGIYSLGYEFFEFLKASGSVDHIPITQGSSRTSTSSGRYLYKRNASPWLDSRKADRHHKFIPYKLLQEELSYWMGVARDRMNSGEHSCQLCAIPIDQDDSRCALCHGATTSARFNATFRAAAMTAHNQVLGPETDTASTEPLPGVRFKKLVSVRPYREVADYLSSIEKRQWLSQEHPQLGRCFRNIADLMDQWRKFQMLAIDWEIFEGKRPALLIH